MRKKILQRNEEGKKYPAGHLEGKKYPTQQIARKKILDEQKSPPPPPPKELNGRSLIIERNYPINARGITQLVNENVFFFFLSLRAGGMMLSLQMARF